MQKQIKNRQKNASIKQELTNPNKNASMEHKFPKQVKKRLSWKLAEFRTQTGRKGRKKPKNKKYGIFLFKRLLGK